MSQQNRLFTEDVLDALGDVVRSLGGAKIAGPMMRPDLPALQAARWVLDCLNRDRRERFDPDQVLFLLRKGRETGCHSAMNYISDEAGYTRPSPLEPLDEMAELQRQYIDSVKEQRRIADRLERIGGLRSVA
jgi:hypothetical protein